jgi:hypothetical protein
MNTDTHGSFLKKKPETERHSYSSAKIRPIKLIFTPRPFQKSPLRPPFLKGGRGDFRESWPGEKNFTKFKESALKYYRFYIRKRAENKRSNGTRVVCFFSLISVISVVKNF